MRVTPGDYVELRVTDNGHGMSAATRDRVFEPFFTTKDVGKGTGLGLPTVYGIVKQSDGYIWVNSEEGVGTTFKIYMPSVPGAPAHTPPSVVVNPPQGQENVLIVEDDEDVRVLTALMVSRAGYHVRTAESGDAALALIDKSVEPVRLVISDMVMPGMTGRRFAEELASRKVGAKVLYMSGYIDDQRVMGPDEHFIGKPFSSAALLRKIREVLDGPPRGVTSATSE
ncbi:MAG: ATP-binding protein [Acidimicrobiia bacterium]